MSSLPSKGAGTEEFKRFAIYRDRLRILAKLRQAENLDLASFEEKSLVLF